MGNGRTPPPSLVVPSLWRGSATHHGPGGPGSSGAPGPQTPLYPISRPEDKGFFEVVVKKTDVCPRTGPPVRCRFAFHGESTLVEDFFNALKISE